MERARLVRSEPVWGFCAAIVARRFAGLMPSRVWSGMQRRANQLRRTGAVVRGRVLAVGTGRAAV